MDKSLFDDRMLFALHHNLATKACFTFTGGVNGFDDVIGEVAVAFFWSLLSALSLFWSLMSSQVF